jgi:hypothetical protein
MKKKLREMAESEWMESESAGEDLVAAILVDFFEGFGDDDIHEIAAELMVAAVKTAKAWIDADHEAARDDWFDRDERRMEAA